MISFFRNLFLHRSLQPTIGADSNNLSQDSTGSHISTFSNSSLNERPSVLLRVLSLSEQPHHHHVCCLRVSAFDSNLFTSTLFSTPPCDPINSTLVVALLLKPQVARTLSFTFRLNPECLIALPEVRAFYVVQFPNLHSANAPGTYLRLFAPFEIVAYPRPRKLSSFFYARGISHSPVPTTNKSS